MGRDTVQQETSISTISQEYLLEFTSEYNISEALYPKLLGPEDRIVDFPEGKARSRVDVFQQEAWEKYPAMLHQALRLPKNLEHSLFLGRRESVPNYCGLAYECSKRWNAGREYVFPRGCEMEDPATATESSGVPSIIERSPLDFANENPSQQLTGPEDQETAASEVPPPRTGKSLAAIELGMGSTRPIHVPQGAPVDMSDPDQLSFVDPQSRPSADVAQSSKGDATMGDLKSENTSFASMVGSLKSIYRPEWGITNGSMLDTPEACQDLVDHVAPPGYFSKLRHMYNDDFLKQYNVNLARQVAIGSQLRLRFEQEAKLLKKSVAQVAHQDKRIQARENKIKNLETLLEAEADMKKAAENKSAELSQELENMRALFSDLQVSNNRLSQQVSTLQEQRCVEIDACLDALSIYFDEELYPHMLTAIAGCKWMIERGLRLAVMKCGESIELTQAFADVVLARIAKGMSEGLKHGVEHEQDKLDLEAIEAYDPKAEAKYIAALHALKNLNSSQLTIPVYSKVRDPMDPWACKEEILLADAIAANVSRAVKKKKCRVVCRTHGVGSAHHARSDGISVFVPTIAPQLETSDEASPQLLRSSSLPVIHS
nr:hypothetical protein [Tanacetum cinerariifolium]